LQELLLYFPKSLFHLSSPAAVKLICLVKGKVSEIPGKEKLAHIRGPIVINSWEEHETDTLREK